MESFKLDRSKLANTLELCRTRQLELGGTVIQKGTTRVSNVAKQSKRQTQTSQLITHYYVVYCTNFLSLPFSLFFLKISSLFFLAYLPLSSLFRPFLFLSVRAVFWGFLIIVKKSHVEEEEIRGYASGRGGPEHVHHLLQRRELTFSALLASHEPPAPLFPDRRTSRAGLLLSSSHLVFSPYLIYCNFLVI